MFLALAPIIVLLAQQDELLIEKARHLEVVTGRLDEAVEIYRRVAASATAGRPVRARALAELGRTLEKLGRPQAREAYERVVREFADQSELAAFARERLVVLGSRDARRQPLSRRILQTGSARLLKVSANGKHLAFAETSGPLLVRNLETEQVKTFGVHPVSDSRFVGSAAFSADSRRIAFLEIGGGRRQLNIADLDTGAARAVEGDWSGFFVNAWMADSRSLVATVWHHGERLSQLALISLSDGSVKRLTPADRSASAGTPSPDGRYLAYQAAPSSHHPSDIHVLELTTGTVRVVVEHPATDKLLGWAADGLSILFSSDRSGTHDIWMQAVVVGEPKGAPRMVKRDIGSHSPIGLSSVGALYQSVEAGGNELFVQEYDPGRGALTGVPVPLKPRYALNGRAPGDAAVIWSPDGRFLAYLAKGNTKTLRSNGLVIRSLETGEEISVPVRQSLFFYQLAWSPDQTRFVVAGNDESGIPGVFVVDRRSGADRRLANLDAPESVTADPAWLPDGRTILYKRKDREQPTVFHLLLASLETGSERILHSGFHMTWLKLSADGQRIAFVKNLGADRVLMIQELDGGAIRELVRVKAPKTLVDVNWDPHSSFLIYVERNGRANELWRVPSAGGPPQRIGSLPWLAAALTVHPGGRQIGFTWNRRITELWITENYMPE